MNSFLNFNSRKTKYKFLKIIQFTTKTDRMFESISQKSEQSHESVNKPIKHRKKWEFEQTKKYYEFLLVYRDVLEQTEKKQKQRIYNKMSDHVGSRSTHQCRSHHQKIMKRYSSIDNFIASFRGKMASLGIRDAAKLEDDCIYQKRDLNRVVNKPQKLEQTSEGIQIFIDDQQQSFRRLFQKQKLLGNIRSSQETLGKENQLYKIQKYEYKDYFEKNALRLPLNEKSGEFSGIGNDQISGNCMWAERSFPNPLNQERFFSKQFPCYRDDYCCLHGDYCRLSRSLESMTQKTLNSNNQPVFYKTASENKNLQEQFQSISPCVSNSKTQNSSPNSLNLHFEQNNIQSSNKSIKKTNDKQSNYKMWFEKTEGLHQNGDQSDSEEIQRELIKEITINVLKEFGLIKEKDMQNQKLQNIPDLNLKPHQIQLPKSTNPSNKPKNQIKAIFPPQASEQPLFSLFPDPFPASCKKDLEDRRRTEDSYQTQSMPKSDSSEQENRQKKQMENQYKQFVKTNDLYHQQAFFGERESYQDFPPGYETPVDFQHFYEFQDQNHPSQFERLYPHEPQTPSFAVNFPPRNNPHYLNGFNPVYMQPHPYSNQNSYSLPMSRYGPYYSYQKRQPNSKFQQRGRRN